MPEIDLEGYQPDNEPDVDALLAERFGREAVATPEPTEEATPVEETAVSEEQPRDDQGRFATREQPEVYEEPESETEQEQQLILGKYRSYEELEQAHQALESRLGSQGSEVGQLRSELEQLRSRLEQPQQPQFQRPITEQDVEAIDMLAQSNPHAALAQANAIDPTGMLTDRVMDIWYMTNPREAGAFQTAVALQEQEQRLAQMLQPVVQTTQQSAEEQAFVQAWENVQTSRPDLNEQAPRIEAVLNENPALARAIVNAQSPDEKAALLTVAYDAAKGVNSEALTQGQQKIAAEQAEAARLAKTQASLVKPGVVGSQPGTLPEEPDAGARIKAGILGSSDTDVLSGLEFN